MEKRKVVIIGAGHVGSHCASALAMSGVGEEIVLVDIIKEKAVAHAMDIADSVSFAPSKVKVRAGEYKDCEDAQLIVISIGEPRKPGQTRLDLLDRSVVLLKPLIEELKKYSINGVIVTITNPADIVADYIRKGLGMDRSRVFGTGTLLDTARLIHVLSEKSGISSDSINAFSMGEHGDSSMIPFSSVTIGGLPLDSFDISKDEVLYETRQRGMTIIEGKGSTEFGIGSALTRMAACILRDEKKVMPASVLLEGEYGHQGIHCGVPCIIGSSGIEKIVELPLNDEEQRQLKESCDIIRKHIERIQGSNN